MRKKTAKNLSEIKGRSKIPNDLYREMTKFESNIQIDKVDLEHDSNTLKAIYYSNSRGQWDIQGIFEVPYSEEQAESFFGESLSKAEFLIKLIEDQTKVKNMLDSILGEEEKIDISPETDKSLKLAFNNIARRIKPDNWKDLTVKDNMYSQEFQKIQYFTPREEDDEFPDFNTHDHNSVRDIVENEIKSFGIKYKRFAIHGHEQSWFVVEVYL